MSIYDYQPLLIFFIIVAACLGAVLGSFLNCAAWRIVHGESFLKGRSHCPACGHELGALELIPVVSWLIQKGKCRNCGSKISIRYPLTEIILALVTVLCLLRFDLTVLCLRNYIFLCCLFLLTLTDLDSMEIPDGCLITAAIVWAAALPFAFPGWHDVIMSLVSAVVFGGGLLGISLLMDRILKRDSLGGGDIKLFAVIGLYLGLIGTLFTLLLSCIVGLLMNLIRRLRNRDEEIDEESDDDEDIDEDEGDDDGRQFPFGPAIAISAAFMLLYGAPLISWYTGLFG